MYVFNIHSHAYYSLGYLLPLSDGNLIDGKEYYTYQTLCGMETLCRALAFSKHKVTLNRFGGIAFESVPSRIVTPIGNVKQMTMKLRTIRRRITGHCWHELHMEGWVVKLPDDAEAKRWMSHLKNIPGGQSDKYKVCLYNWYILHDANRLMGNKWLMCQV